MDKGLINRLRALPCLLLEAEARAKSAMAFWAGPGQTAWEALAPHHEFAISRQVEILSDLESCEGRTWILRELGTRFGWKVGNKVPSVMIFNSSPSAPVTVAVFELENEGHSRGVASMTGFAHDVSEADLLVSILLNLEKT